MMGLNIVKTSEKNFAWGY